MYESSRGGRNFAYCNRHSDLPALQPTLPYFAASGAPAELSVSGDGLGAAARFDIIELKITFRV
jgi:hypothetical protein